MVGDLIIGEETGNLWQIHWNGTRFEGTKFAHVSQWEGATMAPAGMVQVNSTTASVTLNGTVSDDGLPTGGALTSVWTKVSGPGTTTFTSLNTPITSVSFSVPGTYVLRLTASDSELTSSSDVTVVISANAPPVVSAGPSKEITTPDPVSLQGTVTDDGLPAGGTISTYWTKAIGPGSVQFTTPALTPRIISPPQLIPVARGPTAQRRRAEEPLLLTLSQPVCRHAWLVPNGSRSGGDGPIAGVQQHRRIRGLRWGEHSASNIAAASRNPGRKRIALHRAGHRQLSGPGPLLRRGQYNHGCFCSAELNNHAAQRQHHRTKLGSAVYICSGAQCRRQTRLQRGLWKWQ